MTRHRPRTSPRHGARHVRAKRTEPPAKRATPEEKADEATGVVCSAWRCCSSCLHSVGTICSYNPAYRRRNQRFLLLLTGVVVSSLYMGMGVLGIGLCPVQPALPYWVVATGACFAVGSPILLLYYVGRLSPYLKHSANEDVHRSVYVGLRRERHRAGGAARLALLGAGMVAFGSWWVFGAVLVYSVHPFVKSRLDEPGDLVDPNFCDGPVYNVTLQLQSLTWGTLILGALWLASSLLFDERLRRSCVRLLRYEVVHPDQLSYELHRHRATITRTLRRSAGKRLHRLGKAKRAGGSHLSGREVPATRMKSGAKML